MMRRCFILPGLAAVQLCLAACSFLPVNPVAGKTQLSGQEAVTLENRYLKLTAVPGTMGAISSLCWLPGKSEFFKDYKYSCTSINELLPEQKTVTVWGNRTLVWNGTVLFYQPMAKFAVNTAEEAVSLQMSGKFIGGLPIEISRKVTLEKDSALVKIAVTVTNFGKTEQDVRLWEHLVPNQEGSIPDVSLICGDGVRRLGRYQDTEKHSKGLIVDTFKDGNLNRYFVPGADWVAATGGKTPLTVFLRTDEKNLAQDGFFYTQKDAVAKIHTVEILLKSLKIAPGKSQTVEVEMGVLSHLKTLRRLTKNYGFDFSLENGTLVWHASALKPQNSRKMLVKAGSWQMEFSLPALEPGKSVSGKLTGVPAVNSNDVEFVEK